jgi:hypothetical protein
MCVANQDAREAVKETAETDSIIGVLSEVDSHQVRIDMFLSVSTYFLSFCFF